MERKKGLYDDLVRALGRDPLGEVASHYKSEGLGGFIPPEAKQSASNLAHALSEALQYTDAGDVKSYQDDTSELVRALMESGLGDAMEKAPAAMTSLAALMVPGISARMAKDAGDAYRMWADIPPGPNERGMFAGVNAQTADLEALERAKQMEQEGADRNDIWRTTGWGRGADKDWRFEINDKPSRYTPHADEVSMPDPMTLARDYYQREVGDNAPPFLTGKLPALEKEALAYGQQTVDAARRRATGIPLSNVFEHEEFYKAYPEARNLDAVRETLKGADGTYFNNRVTYGGSLGSERTSLLHELQHYLQKKEGFARGGSQAEFIREGYSKEDADRMYRRLAGEVEARNVQKRAYLPAEGRRQIPPWETEEPGDLYIRRFKSRS